MRFRSALTAIALVTLGSFGTACLPAPSPVAHVVKKSPSATAPRNVSTRLSVMGSSTVDAATMEAWYEHKIKGLTRPVGATVPVRTLAQMFIDEGRDEGVRGDVAFAQAMVETGWLRFSERMPRSNNNFSGIGAVDGGTGSASFSTARLGVRAQIQHLRAYADSTASTRNLAHGLVDPRFDLVSPKGKAPDWSNFGKGIWATDPGYAAKVLRLHSELVAFHS